VCITNCPHARVHRTPVPQAGRTTLWMIDSPP